MNDDVAAKVKGRKSPRTTTDPDSAMNKMEVERPETENGRWEECKEVEPERVLQVHFNNHMHDKRARDSAAPRLDVSTGNAHSSNGGSVRRRRRRLFDGPGGFLFRSA